MDFNLFSQNSGYLHLILGPMFSGKTTELIRIYNKYTACGIKCLMINHSYDTRYSNEGHVTSHSRGQIKSLNINRLQDLIENDACEHDVILINEGQFFPDLYEVVKIIVEQHNKIVYIALSIDLLHHGHINLINHAKKYGKVTAGLLTDSAILAHKRIPLLNFNQRKEILESIKFVNKVIKSKWLIDEKFLKKNKIFKLVHGNDNSNSIDKQRLIIFNRTKGISSTTIRKRSRKILRKINK